MMIGDINILGDVNMTAKNNHTEFTQRVPHYGLRKLSVGVASVLLSTSFYLGINEATGLADSNAQSSENTQTAQITRADHSESNNVTLGNSQSAETNSGQAQSEESTPVEVPTAQRSINDMVGRQNGITVNRDTNVTEQASQTIGDPGQTTLNLNMTIPANVISDIHNGDYIDIHLGLPYKDQDGQEHFMSYGAVNGDANPIKMEYAGVVVGYIVPAKDAGDSYNGYKQTIGQDGHLQVVDNDNTNSSSLGTSNAYYRIVFNGNLANYVQNHPGNVSPWEFHAQLNWYNGLSDTHKKMDKPADNIKLYTTGQDGSYTPDDDLQIGNYKTGSGLSFQVKHVDQNQSAVDLTNTNKPSDHTSAFQAHEWFVVDGHSYLRTSDDNTQSVGLTLTTTDQQGNQLGQDFTITVSKPAGEDGLLSTNFVSDKDLADQLQKVIVPISTDSSLVDNLTGDNAGDYHLSNQPLYRAPKVKVQRTLSADGNTATYHVQIDAPYQGFTTSYKDGSDNLSPFTLITWKPAKATDLLPPDDVKSFDQDGQKVTYHPDNLFAGYPIRNPEIKNYLESRPWQVSVSSTQGFSFSSQYGYWIDSKNDVKPENGAFVSGHFYGWVNQRIHFVDENGQPMKGNDGQPLPVISRSLEFESDDQNQFSQAKDLKAIGVPEVDGYDSFLGQVQTVGSDQDHDEPVKNNGKVKTVGDPITKVGAELGLTYPHNDIVLYVVYKTHSDTPDPTPQKTYTVTVHYVDEQGHTIKNSVIDHNRYKTGDSYDTTSDQLATITYDGKTYEYKAIQPGDQEKGKIKNSNVSVTYIYRLKTTPTPTPSPKTYTVTVHYVDEQHNPIEDPVTQSTRYKTGDEYTTRSDWRETITHDGKTYEYKEIQPGDQEKGKIRNSNVSVTYIYRLKTTPTPTPTPEPETYNVYVHYVDEQGNVIKDQVTDSSNLLDHAPYNTTDHKPATISFNGQTYELDHVLASGDPEDGTVNGRDVNVTYVYKLHKTPNTPDHPHNPGQPSNPSQPDHPSNPEQPANPDTPNVPTNPATPAKPVQPNKPGQSVKPGNPNQPVVHPNTKQQSKLPQTGNQRRNTWAIAGLGLLGLASLIGLGKKRQIKN